ncbi:hypothetical protein PLETTINGATMO_15120 [Pseudothermotoga lettingae TMO]|nr:hypothetical protein PLETTINGATMO_15120 [Pseudothermotoga lettingae TMO]
MRFRGVLYVLVGISFLPTFSNMKKSGKVTITTLYSFKQSELLAYSAILFLFVVLGITNSI